MTKYFTRDLIDKADRQPLSNYEGKDITEYKIKDWGGWCVASVGDFTLVWQEEEKSRTPEDCNFVMYGKGEVRIDIEDEDPDFVIETMLCKPIDDMIAHANRVIAKADILKYFEDRLMTDGVESIKCRFLDYDTPYVYIYFKDGGHISMEVKQLANEEMGDVFDMGRVFKGE